MLTKDSIVQGNHLTRLSDPPITKSKPTFCVTECYILLPSVPGMIRARDESRAISSRTQQIDLFRLETAMMDRSTNGKMNRNIEVAKCIDLSQFLSKEFPGGFPDDDWTKLTLTDKSSPWPTASVCDQFVSESEDESSHRLMPFKGFSSSKGFPATRALELACKLNSKAMPFRTASEQSGNKMISKRSLKRCRSSMGGFSVADLVEATKPVEDSIAFPSIEWQIDEDDDDDADNKSDERERPRIGRFPTPVPDDDLDDIIEPPRAKRQCRGLVRSKHVYCNLSQLEGIG